jgi:predicted transcriptional regulator
MNIFVPVYIAAGISEKDKNNKEKKDKLINEAIDYQLTNKVLRKLEYEELNKEAAQKLRALFESNGLTHAKNFIDWKTGGIDS